MEKKMRMWLKACLIIAGLLFFCFLAGRREQERGTDYEKEARIRQYEADERVVKLETTLLAYGEMIREETEEEAEGQTKRMLTTAGLFTYETAEAESCLYRQVTAYIRDGVILDVVEAAEQEETILANVWVSEIEEKQVLCFLSGTLFSVPYEAGRDNREQVADLVLQDGEVRACRFKKEKVTGKLLGVTADAIRLPEESLALSEDVRVYRLYGKLEECSLADLPVGYVNTDFVLEDGSVCACLISSEEQMETIRVLLQAGNYNGRYHNDVTVTADCAYALGYGTETETHAAGETVTVTADSAYFADSDRVFVTLAANTGRIILSSIERARERTDYRGSLEIVKTADGLAVVNELLLEEYLYGVVPSEMPASYPVESLKAQAVCARTYAYRNMKSAGFPELGAHVDDSTAFQVYGNTEEKAETTAAVKATKGRLLFYGEEPIDTYYYSTSCGYGTDTRAWNGMDAQSPPYLQARAIAAEGMGMGDAESTETGADNPETEDAGNGQPYTPETLREEAVFAQFISAEQPQAYECQEAWYRWRYEVAQVDVEEMEQRLAQRYTAAPGFILTKGEDDTWESRQPGPIGTLQEISITERNAGGNAAELVIVGSEGTYAVRTEYNIRYILNNGSYSVVRRDGTEVASKTLLPSAFFMVTTGKEDGNVIGYTVVGGGYGHGIGMSQNGARNMAQAGLTEEEILTFFYEGSRIETIY